MPEVSNQYRIDRDIRREKMRKRIMRAAMKLFLKHGFDNVTIRKIASEIKYSPALIYRYFKNKDAIFLALRREGFELFYKHQIKARTGRSVRQRIYKHGEAYIDFALSNRNYYELMFLIPIPAERIAEDREWLKSLDSFGLLCEDVKDAMDEGLMKRAPAKEAAMVLWSQLHGIISLIIRDRMKHHTDASGRDIAIKVMRFLLKNILTK